MLDNRLWESRSPKRVLFLTYQRTTFTDALRTAICLKQHGAYQPAFLVCAKPTSLVQQEMDECQRRGIPCLIRSPVVATRPRYRTALKIVLQERLGILW